MWGTQGWNQWALQPAMFNDVPHEQIDWAALAKQWIQMQQTQPNEGSSPVPPAISGPPLSGANILPTPPGHVPIPSDDFSEGNVSAPLLKTPIPPDGFPPERTFDSEPPGTFVPKPTDNTYWNKSQWEASAVGDIDERMWNSPSIEPAVIPPPPAPLIGGKETFDYGHMHDNPPLAMQSIDYNHMSDYSYNPVYAPPPESQYEQYWSQVNSTPTITPMFLKKDRIQANLPVEEDTSQIDAAKRKQLPAWIRDGLEKMEQERLKRLEKERAAKERAEKLAADKKNFGIKKDSSDVFVPSKSKFESDSEAEDDDADRGIVKKSSPIHHSPPPEEDLRTEEEKKQDMIMKVRRILTEILLTVTNSEMLAIAQEVYNKAMAKAPARQLATTSSLASVASGLRGLASYGTESETSDAEEDNDAVDSEEELYQRIKEKKRLFAIKEKKILAELERREQEERSEIEKQKHENNKKNLDKEMPDNEKRENLETDVDKPTASVFQSSIQLSSNLSNEIPFISEDSGKPASDKKESRNAENVASNSKKEKPKNSDSYDSSSSSSGSESESSEKHNKKSRERDKKGKEISKKEKHSSRENHRRRSRSRDSDSSDRHKKSHSYDKSHNSSSSKKKKKYKRSDSSSSSSSASRRKKHSSKSESSHGRGRSRRSRSYDRSRKRHRSASSSRSHHRSDDHSHRSSHSYKHDDRDKHERRHKEERRYRESKRSPSPSRHSSKLPKKYRTSRSLSSESESSGKKSKKSRNR